MRKIYSGRNQSQSGDFIFVVNTNTSIAPVTSAAGTFVLPILPPASGSFAFHVDWGDATSSDINASNYNTERSHTYTTPSAYTITISGTVRGFNFSNMPSSAFIDDADKVVTIENWGGFETTGPQSFRRCSQLQAVNSTDAPYLTGGNHGLGMFLNCGKLKYITNIENWYTANLTIMASMFNGCGAFDGNLSQPDLSSWNVSNVTNMALMFFNCNNFDGQLFQVTSTTSNIDSMFQGATSFNNNTNFPPITGWDVSSVSDFSDMFFGAATFNRPLSLWDTSSGTNMTTMFAGNNAPMAFNQPIGNWNVSNVTSMTGMLHYCNSFDQDLSGWNVNAWNVIQQFGYPTLSGSNGTSDLNLSTTNYNALLIAWDNYGFPSTPTGIVQFGSSQYSLTSPGNSVVNARNSLIAKWGGISDGGGI